MEVSTAYVADQPHEYGAYYQRWKPFLNYLFLFNFIAVAYRKQQVKKRYTSWIMVNTLRKYLSLPFYWIKSETWCYTHSNRYNRFDLGKLFKLIAIFIYHHQWNRSIISVSLQSVHASHVTVLTTFTEEPETNEVDVIISEKIIE